MKSPPTLICEYLRQPPTENLTQGLHGLLQSQSLQAFQVAKMSSIISYREVNGTLHHSKFVKFSDAERLPFPLNQPILLQNALVASLALNLLIGIKIRVKIVKYLQSVEIEKNPINYFFWLDQINGAFLGINITLTLIALLTPFPIKDIIGGELCNWIDIFGCVYLTGTSVWSFNIALYRILIMKVKGFESHSNTKYKALVIMTLLGLLILIIPSSLAAYYDHGFR